MDEKKSMAETELIPIYNTTKKFTSDQRVVCIHHSDADGVVSALLMKTYFNDVWFIGTNYGKRINYNIIQPGSVIFLVDFTLPVDEMRYLNSCYTLVWIDHHATAWEHAYEEFKSLEGIRSSECSAAKLVWKYLHPTDPCPRSVTLVSDYDTWNFTDPSALPFHYGLDMFSISPRTSSDAFIRKLFYQADFTDNLIAMGRRIASYIETKNALLSKDGAFVSEINGHKVLCMNIRNCNSMVLDEAAKRYPDIKLRSTFGYNSSICKYKCSLYSDDKDLICQDIDARFKGHKSAAGMECELSELPYKLPTPELKEPTSEDFVTEIEMMGMRDPLIYKHDTASLGYLCKLNGCKSVFEGMEVYAVNHPYWTVAAMYNTSMIVDFSVVIFWNLTASGWYRYRIYPLEKNRLSLQDLSNVIPGSKIVGNAVWCYRDKPLESTEVPLPSMPQSNPPQRKSFYNYPASRFSK